MNAYLARTSEGVLDLAIRAEDSGKAKELLAATNNVEVTQLTSRVAKAMQIPEEEGIYQGVLWRWLRGPTNILGELPSG
jgi:hypothetical protein